MFWKVSKIVEWNNDGVPWSNIHIELRNDEASEAPDAEALVHGPAAELSDKDVIEERCVVAAAEKANELDSVGQREAAASLAGTV